MSNKSLLENPDRLIALAGRIADALSIRREELGAALETTLRASIATATHAYRGYHALLDACERSELPLDFIGDSKAQCERSLRKLREHVAESIGLICGTLESEQIVNLIAGFA
jgi:hypothetical protein